MKLFTNKYLNLKIVALFVAISLILSSCEKKDGPQPGNELPITLDCNYFNDNPGAVLKDNPKAPIDYIVTCKMSIQGDVVIEPGVTIMFKTDAGLKIEGTNSLKAAGTSDKKITFTGEDKVPGSWSGIYFESENVKNELSHTVVEYAGGSRFNSNNDLGNVILYSGTTIKFTNNLIQYGKTYGLNQNYKTITTSIENNVFKENNIPIRVKAENIDIIKSNNEFIGNTINKVEVHIYTSEPKGTQTWRKLTVPYFTTAGTTSIFIKGHLTIEPGTIIEMGEGTGFKVDENASLKIVGTASDKIIIRGLTPVAGSWDRIYYTHTQSPNNQIKHAEIKHAGANPSVSKGAIYLWASPRLLIEDTHFEDILSCSINGYQGPGNIDYQENLTVGSNVTHTNVGGEICSN
ncbi:MAG TPA: hypothetical protein VLZ83_04750 [Edaphocola sp.]|nr:hypothetical protein [Edaphocola sp.]